MITVIYYIRHRYLDNKTKRIILLITIPVSNSVAKISELRYIYKDYFEHESGVQQGIFKGRYSISEKGHIKTFKKKIRHMNIVFQIHTWRRDWERFTDIVALKTNDSYYYFLSQQGRIRGLGVYAPGNFWNHSFSILKNRPF